MNSYISVILTSHNNTPYLIEAIDSLKNQTLTREKFEVVVVRDFNDKSIDEMLKELGFRDIFTDEKSFKGKVDVGIRESKGDILTFLEDDDTYYPERLKIIEEEFRKNKKLAYYHNNHVPIDASGNKLNKTLFYNIPDRLEIAPGESYGKLLSLASQYSPDFNTSSMAVRKEDLLQSMSYFERILAGVDTFIYFACARKEKHLLIDSRPMTNYRIHNSQTIRNDEFEVFMRRKNEAEIEKVNSYRITYDMTVGTPAEPFSRIIYLEFRSKTGIIQAANGDKGLLPGFGEIMFMISKAISLKKKYIIVLMAWSVLFKLFPRIVRRPYYRYRMKEHRKVQDA